MARDTLLAAEPLDLQAELGAFLGGLKGEGGVVTFLGIARPRTSNGAQVERLLLDHHPRLTQLSLDEIADAARKRFEITQVRIAHRFGEVAAGEPIVFAAAAAAHRRAAFEAADYIMDRLKTDAVFWKREDAVDGSRWIEPTEADRAERARWNI